MISVVAREQVEKSLGIQFKNLEFNLLYTDNEDTTNIVALCGERKEILEVGTFYGHTTENIAKNNTRSFITTINISKQLGVKMGLEEQSHELLDEKESGKIITCHNVRKIIMDSDSFFKETNHKWDAIFLDGDHSKKQIEKDTRNALAHLKENGILIWHDVYNKDGLCGKCSCEPDNNDVREYLESLEFQINKIERSWVAYYVNSRT